MRFFFLIVFAISISFAQDTETLHVIYLKDGSIIKGNIIEVIPNESIKIKSLGGSILIFKAIEVKSIKREKVKLESSSGLNSPSLSYDPDKYKTQINIGKYGWATVAGLTLLGSAASGDVFFATTVIPIVGPFITMYRIENDPSVDYLPGAKSQLMVSGVLQVTFFSFWMYHLVKKSNYESEYGFDVRPNSNNIGFTLSYKF